VRLARTSQAKHRQAPFTHKWPDQLTINSLDERVCWRTCLLMITLKLC